MTAIDQPHRDEVLASAPLPMRLFWYATRGRFERLERAAFGGIRVDVSDLRPVPTHVPTPVRSVRVVLGPELRAA